MIQKYTDTVYTGDNFHSVVQEYVDDFKCEHLTELLRDKTGSDELFLSHLTIPIHIHFSKCTVGEKLFSSIFRSLRFDQFIHVFDNTLHLFPRDDSIVINIENPKYSSQGFLRSSLTSLYMSLTTRFIS